VGASDANKGCLLEKINEFRKLVQDTAESVEDRRFAPVIPDLCPEDMHIPMHVGDSHDRDGNDKDVRPYGEGTNMHKLWDSLRFRFETVPSWTADCSYQRRMVRGMISVAGNRA
jgi:hypothetical protein